MHIMHVALGGCIKAPPVAYGLTEDTGGHIGYILGAAQAQAARSDVRLVEIVTRRFDGYGAPYNGPGESVGRKLHLRRLATASPTYLSKEALEAEIGSFSQAFEAEIAARPAARRPTAIHAHFADAVDGVKSAADRFGIPIIYTAHSLAIDKETTCQSKGLRTRISREEMALGVAAAVIASSRDEVERQIPQYPNADPAKVRRIMPGADPMGPADTDRALTLLRPFLREPRRPLVLAVARPVWKKNLPALVDMFASAGLADRANLCIVPGLRDGLETGPTETLDVHRALFAAIDRHDLHGSVALPKKHEGESLAALYRFAAETGGVFANPALTEPFGLTILEAARTGLPVVATCHGGPGDIIDLIGHGVTADPRDVTAFGAAIARIIDDPLQWRRAASAAQAGIAEWTWERYASHACDLIREVTAVRRPALGIPTDWSVATIQARSPSRMLVSDIDGTLTGDTAACARFTAWRRQARDHLFVVATGRSISEARFVLQRWDLPMPDAWITSVGSEIYGPAPDGRLQEDIAFGRAVSKDWAPAEIRAVVDGLTGVHRQSEIEFRARKLSWLYADAGAPARVRLALDAAGLPATVIASHGNLLDVLPRGAGKGAAMLWLAKQLGIAADNLIAAGDSGNDLDLLAAAPQAVAVANRSSELDPILDRHGLFLARERHADGVLEALGWIGSETRQVSGART